MNARLIILMALILLLSTSACTPSPLEPGVTPLGSQIPAEVRDAQLIGEPFVEPRYERVQTDNCDGHNRLIRVERSLSQGQTTFFEVEVGVAGLVKGAIIPKALEAKLEARIQTALGRILSNTYQQGVYIELETQPGTANLHTVTWYETKVRGLIEVVYPSGIGRVGFEKIIGVELGPRTSEPLFCPGNVARPTATDTLVFATAVATSQPSPSTPTPQPPTAVENSQPVPIRDHFAITAGSGIFAEGTVSDGQAPYSEQWLWDNNRFKIQRIRREEYSDGCDAARYTTDVIWIGGTKDMKITVNGEMVGQYTIDPNAHGYVFKWPIRFGDQLCAVDVGSEGFHIILGPDVYYHYDSYCYRGGC
jgi:hypothetical protein